MRSFRQLAVVAGTVAFLILVVFNITLPNEVTPAPEPAPEIDGSRRQQSAPNNAAAPSAAPPSQVVDPEARWMAVGSLFVAFVAAGIGVAALILNLWHSRAHIDYMKQTLPGAQADIISQREPFNPNARTSFTVVVGEGKRLELQNRLFQETRDCSSTVPVWLIWGSKDPATQFDASLEVWAGHCKDATPHDILRATAKRHPICFFVQVSDKDPFQEDAISHLAAQMAHFGVEQCVVSLHPRAAQLLSDRLPDHLRDQVEFRFCSLLKGAPDQADPVPADVQEQARAMLSDEGHVNYHEWIVDGAFDCRLDMASEVKRFVGEDAEVIILPVLTSVENALKDPANQKALPAQEAQAQAKPVALVVVPSGPSELQYFGDRAQDLIQRYRSHILVIRPRPMIAVPEELPHDTVEVQQDIPPLAAAAKKAKRGTGFLSAFGLFPRPGQLAPTN